MEDVSKILLGEGPHPMTDIVKRLRSFSRKNYMASLDALWNACDEAADEIERLREQVDAEALISGLIRDESSQLRFRNAELEALTAAGGRDELQKKYEDLLYSVASKFPGETRHETALRYIRNAEAESSGAATQPAQEGSDV